MMPIVTASETVRPRSKSSAAKNAVIDARWYPAAVNASMHHNLTMTTPALALLLPNFSVSRIALVNPEIRGKPHRDGQLSMHNDPRFQLQLIPS